MSKKPVIILTSLLVLILAGCGNDKDAGPVIVTPDVEVKSVFAIDSDAEPASIPDDTSIGTGIDGLFGGEDGEPLAIGLDDNITDVIERASNATASSR